MYHSSNIIKVLLFLTFSLHLSSAETHSMHFVMTEAKGINFPEFTAVGLVDVEQILYYDSSIRKLIPTTEWMKKFDVDNPQYKDTYTQITQDLEESLKINLGYYMQIFGQTEGIHSLQVTFGCDPNNTGTHGYLQFGYDGEDFISLDLKTPTFIAASDKALSTKIEWESRGLANLFKSYLENDCVNWLKVFLSYGRETLERKDPPEASVFHKRSSSPELVCHATGFFPRGLMIFWEKDGEELHEDVDVRETLPNQDGTFQKRAVLRVSPEELKEHEYTCVVQHSSLEKDLVLKAPDEGSFGAGAIVGIVLAVLAGVAVVVAVGVLIWKKKKPAVRTRSSSFISESSNSNTSEVSSSSE